ncbi:MAG TPA: GNAT family N-acetyltransferase, partial [Chitinophagaceae bacterium]|nr:GNAT family N-acetyltransferase [Chitinophagaceae bacterium]
MEIIEATEKKSFRDFLVLPKELYKNDPNWIPYSSFDIKNLFDPAKNLFFKHGCCDQWVLLDASGKTIGRIAAFINFEKIHPSSLAV